MSLLEHTNSARSSMARLLRGVGHGGRALVGLLVVFVSSSCLFVAPIEEEPPEEDLPPRIPIEGNLDPPLGTVFVDLQGVAQPFAVLSVEDPNESQTLYARVLVEYREVLISSARLEIEADERLNDRVILFQYDPCQEPFNSLRVPEDTEHVLYIAVADAPWADEREIFATDLTEERLRLALRTVPPEDPDAELRSPSVVAWGIQLSGECPE